MIEKKEIIWELLPIPIELDEQNHEEKSRYQSYPIRGFLNVKTGEVKLFLTKAVDRDGSTKIIEALSVNDYAE